MTDELKKLVNVKLNRLSTRVQAVFPKTAKEENLFPCLKNTTTPVE